MKLQELAEKLSLSVSTVSRALNHPDMVAEGTRRRVAEAAEAFGYRPNVLARALRRGNTRTIGMVVSDIQNPFYAAVVKAVEHTLAGQGYTLIVCNANEDKAAKEAALTSLIELQVAAVIHAPLGEDPTLLRDLAAQGTPTVEIDRISSLTDVDSVRVDNRLGAELAARHLLGFGHTRLAVITGPRHVSTARERLEGFQGVLEEAGIELPEAYVEFGDFREASGRRATNRLLALREPPTALFVANNEMAAGVLEALREGGVSVPDEVSLVAFDDARWMRFTAPPLTAIAQPTEAIGRLAAELCLGRIAGRRDAERHLLAPDFIERASCGPPQGGAP